MTPDSPEGLAFRVRSLERDVQALKDGKPEIVSERVTRFAADMHEFRQDVNSDLADLGSKVDALRRTFIGLLATIAGACVLIVITQILVARP